MNQVKVLDHGFVRLVSYMQPDDDALIPEDWDGDFEVVRNARVSYESKSIDKERDDKLIGYLMKNAHTSPFEAMAFTFEVKAPIFVIRQWHRHRTWSYNEVSARYTELPEEYYLPTVGQIGSQSASNKQMRQMEEVAGLEERDKLFIANLQMHSMQGFALYQQHLKRGIPRELARLFIGLNTYTHMFATVNLYNLFHFLRLRLHEHAQYEIRVYAEALLQLIAPIVPAAVKAFKKSRLSQM